MGLPMLHKPVDRMREGFVSLDHETRAQHPVDHTQKHFERNAFEHKMNHLERVYGSHAALRFRMEKAVLMQFQRLPVSSLSLWLSLYLIAAVSCITRFLTHMLAHTLLRRV